MLIGAIENGIVPFFGQWHQAMLLLAQEIHFTTYKIPGETYKRERKNNEFNYIFTCIGPNTEFQLQSNLELASPMMSWIQGFIPLPRLAREIKSPGPERAC